MSRKIFVALNEREGIFAYAHENSDYPMAVEGTREEATARLRRDIDYPFLPEQFSILQFELVPVRASRRARAHTRRKSAYDLAAKRSEPSGTRRITTTFYRRR
jgi:hypothetical protein